MIDWTVQCDSLLPCDGTEPVVIFVCIVVALMLFDMIRGLRK